MNLWVAIPIFFAAASWTTAVIYYGLRAKWWKSPEGRNTEAVSFIVALLLIRLSAIQLFPDYIDRSWTGAPIYTLMGVVAIWRIGLIEKAQRGIRRWRDWKDKNGTPGTSSSETSESTERDVPWPVEDK